MPCSVLPFVASWTLVGSWPLLWESVPYCLHYCLIYTMCWTKFVDKTCTATESKEFQEIQVLVQSSEIFNNKNWIKTNFPHYFNQSKTKRKKKIPEFLNKCFWTKCRLFFQVSFIKLQLLNRAVTTGPAVLQQWTCTMRNLSKCFLSDVSQTDSLTVEGTDFHDKSFLTKGKKKHRKKKNKKKSQTNHLQFYFI